MAKLVDAPSSGGGAARCAGSNPVLGTKTPVSRSEAGIFYLMERMLVDDLNAGASPDFYSTLPRNNGRRK